MGVHINTAKDHDRLAETPEDVLYGSKTQESLPPATSWPTVHNAEVFPIDKRRMLDNALLAQATITVRMAAVDLVAAGITAQPKEDDVWQRASDHTFWKVLMVDVLSFGNEYRLHCNRSTRR